MNVCRSSGTWFQIDNSGVDQRRPAPVLVQILQPSFFSAVSRSMYCPAPDRDAVGLIADQAFVSCTSSRRKSPVICCSCPGVSSGVYCQPTSPFDAVITLTR